MADAMDSRKYQVPGFVIVHLGAGYHSKLKMAQYKSLCKQACRVASRLTKEGHAASYITNEVVSILEQSDLTNAGFGSNLTENGLIQCDAGLMESSTRNFAAVACIEGVRNPIRVAYELLIDQSKNLNGLEPPMILAGQGAQIYALEKGIQISDNKELVSRDAFETFKKAKAVMRSHHCNSNCKDSSDTSNLETKQEHFGLKRKSVFPNSNEDGISCKAHKLKEDRKDVTFNLEDRLDTVGAICVDTYGNVCTAASSGGLILKRSGRVGQAACFGCGCYTSDRESRQRHVVYASSISGCGEHLIKTTLAKSFVDEWHKLDSSCGDDFDDLEMINHSNLLESTFLNSKILKGVDNKLAGCIAIKLTKDTKPFEGLGKDGYNSVKRDVSYQVNNKSSMSQPESSFTLDLVVTSTARTFCVGFMSIKEQKFQFLLLEMPDLEKVGKSIVSQVFHYKL
ncbi:threonine aspartase 1-like isoform X2 [Rhopilema esculentum]|uniref:threonine aspartase 1-like isoform X2 n=1 Tax=Rhopilema esculentum TaxID=499914 RepID=UPI0031D2E3A3